MDQVQTPRSRRSVKGRAVKETRVRVDFGPSAQNKHRGFFERETLSRVVSQKDKPKGSKCLILLNLALLRATHFKWPKVMFKKTKWET